MLNFPKKTIYLWQNSPKFRKKKYKFLVTSDLLNTKNSIK